MRISVLLLSIWISASVAFANNGNEALLERVESYLELGEPKKALKMLSNRLDNEPDNIELRNKRAEVYVLMAKEKEANKEIRSIMKTNKEYSPVMLTCARLKVRIDQTDSALWYIDRGLSLEPDERTREGLYGTKGKILMTMDQYSEAEDCLLKAAESTYVSLDTMRDLASVMTENGKNDEAIIVLEETIDLFGMHMEPLVNAGFVCNKMGRYDEAISYLDLALALDSENPYALANIANSYVKIGGLERALRNINRSINNDNTNSYAYKIKGDCLFAMSQPDRACKEYKKAIDTGYAVLFNQAEIESAIEKSCGSN